MPQAKKPMARRSSSGSAQLPEPSHPFARWGAVAAVAIWAVSVQSFEDPWNKIAAFLSPGIGYLIGQVLDFLITKILEYNDWRLLGNNKHKIDVLYKERQEALAVGADPEIISSIDIAIRSFHRERIKIIATQR